LTIQQFNNTERQRGLSMIEVLIVVVVIGILAVILLNYFNPLEKRDRAVDSRRKSDLNRLTVAMEDYYGDHGCYPDELLCTPADKADDLKPYLGTIPCDPATGESYYYEPEAVDCPQYYRIYTNLYWEQDPQIVEVGCQYGCGPDYAYNYGVSSPNVGLEGKETCQGIWYLCSGDRCDVAGGGCCHKPDEECPPSCDICLPISECYCDDACCGCECPDCRSEDCKERCSQCR